MSLIVPVIDFMAATSGPAHLLGCVVIAAGVSALLPLGGES